jgi:hypothetical protein
MIMHKIVYNNGGNEGYFVEVHTKKGLEYLKVNIEEGTTHELRNIKKKVSVRINAVTLKLEEEQSLGTYLG